MRCVNGLATGLSESLLAICISTIDSRLARTMKSIAQDTIDFFSITFFLCIEASSSHLRVLIIRGAPVGPRWKYFLQRIYILGTPHGSRISYAEVLSNHYVKDEQMHTGPHKHLPLLQLPCHSSDTSLNTNSTPYQPCQIQTCKSPGPHPPSARNPPPRPLISNSPRVQSSCNSHHPTVTQPSTRSSIIPLLTSVLPSLTAFSCTR